ncbi:MAG: hypothetical protein K9N23_13165 [Akkermansiaceae bacterium]|nr:hypothetical protein [Akkermansiaceae bacterium]MCF7732633.1 hypothetical protein [Akkermansiaceae bacterium]
MRRKFELLMKDLWRALELPTKQDYPLTIAAWGARHFSHELVADPLKVRQVLDFIRALRISGVTGRRTAEEALMESLIDLASQCGGELGSTNCPRPSGFDRTTDATAEQQPMLRVLQELHDFALACFQFKRPRDSFGGTRRGLAFEILGEVGGVVDLPQVVDMARKALKKSKSIESRHAANFLHAYFSRRDGALDDAITAELLSLAEAADSRSTAFSALNALVETGTICEFEALDRMDEWKSKHY